MCTIVRVDAKNANTGFTQNLGALCEDTTNAYIFWAGIDLAVRNSAFHNAEIWVRPLNKTTLVLGTATRVDANQVVGAVDPAWDWDGVAVCRLTSGVMVAAYGQQGTAPSTHAKESAANDSTSWGARSVVDDSGANRCIGGLGTDGTVVHALTQDQNTGDLYIYKRTAANTWDSGRKVHDAAGSASSPVFDVIASTRLSSMRCLALSTASIACFVLPYSSAAATFDMVRCGWTIDGWTNVSFTTIKSYVGSPSSISAGTTPKILLGADGRLRAFWIENNSVYGFVPVLAYSDDMGQTWHVIGTPVAFTGKTWDNTYDGAFSLDSSSRMYTSMFDSSDAANVKHYLYQGGDSLTGWEETVCPNLAQNIAGATNADGFLDSRGHFIRVFNAVNAGAYNEVNYLLEADAGGGGGGGTELVEESPSGSDAANIVLRNRLSTKRGWSAHDWHFSSFALWPEGDYTTQRRLPTKIAGLSNIDPSVSDPAVLGAILKFDDPEHYGYQRWMYDEGGTLIPRLDPMLLKIHTKAFPLTDGFGQAIVRGILIRWRSMTSFDVQTWIDGTPVQTDTLPATLPEDSPSDAAAIGERFLPLARFANVGDVCQIRIEDESLYPIVIETIGIMRIPKKIRGRNQ